jgi:hypothetical protein
MKRYSQLFKNAATEGSRAKAAGLTGAKLVGKVAGKTAKSITGIFGMTVALSAWNQLKYPELEENLSEDVKSKPHIILGQDKEGNTIYFSRLGALNDFMEWFGLDTAQQDVVDMLNGKKTIQEQLIDMVKSPVNKALTSVSPAYKTPAELLTGKKLYPDVFKPTDIRDKAQYTAQTLNLRSEYDALTGKPHKPYLESWTDIATYKSDPKESAYWDMVGKKYDFIEKKTGESGGSFTKSKKSMALYNYKLALRYEDEKASEKYLKEYYNLGGTDKGLKQSLAALDPLYKLSKNEGEFLKSLTLKEKEKLKLAQEYYKEVLDRK